MPTQIVMNRRGDSRFPFDAKDSAAVAEAGKRFLELTGAGFIAAVRTGPGTQDLVRTFDPSQEEVIFHPHNVGG